MSPMPLPESVPAGLEVYRLDLDLTRDDATDWVSLVPTERAYAARFARRADSVRFVATRAAARRLLARRLGCDAAEVPLALGAHGKPVVSAAGDVPVFNVSHSGRHALIAVADARDVADVGVDIEHCRQELDFDCLLGLAFTAQESREVRASRNPLQALYERWVGKEAVLKAVGVGVTEHLLSVGIHPLVGGQLALASEVPGWADVAAAALSAPAGYAAALAWRVRAPA